MKLASELKDFCTRLGHDFTHPELLIEATTHSSLSSPTRADNQRMEFLGDRVLALVIAQALLEKDKQAAEGLLAPRFNALVRKEACADMAVQIDLGAALKLGRSEMLSGGRKKTAILGDAMEAVIAAVYLDAGFDTAEKLILRLWDERINAAEEDARDPKTTLQEWAQAHKMPPPKYVEIGRTGPDHAPIFEIEAQLSNGVTAIASASSKRQAQQMAARELLEKVDTNHD